MTVDEMGNEISETTNTIPAGFYCSEKLHSLYWKMMMYKGGCGVIQSTCTKLYRRSILEKVLEKIPENITIGEDAAITYSSLLACKRVMLIDNIVYRYYQRQGSMSKKHDLGIFNSIKIFYDYLYHKCEDAGCIGITNNLKEYTLWLLNIAFNVSFDIKANILWKTDTLFTKCGRRVVLYGAGDVGQSYYDQLSEQDSVDVVAWADKGNYGNVVSGVVLIHPDAILDYKFDSVVIAVAGNKLADKIKDHLIELGVEEKQILWEQPIKDYRRWYFS